MSKRLLAGILAMVMVLGISGCGKAKVPEETGNQTEAGSQTGTENQESILTEETGGGEKLLFAYPQPNSGSVRWEIMGNTVEHLASMVGGEFLFMNVDYSAEAQIKYFEDAIAAGAKGILFWPCADSVLPTITKMCEENQVYWAISFRTINDPEIADMVYSSPYFVGKCFEDEVKAGYTVGKELANAGKKKIAVITGARGDTTGDLRYEGLENACEEFNMEIVAEFRDPQQASDISSATESFLAAYSDLDAVVLLMSVVSDSLNPITKAITDAGRTEVQVACVDFWDNMTELFEQDLMVAAVGHPHIGYDPYICAVKLVNTVSGNPIGDGPVDTEEEMFVIRDYEASKVYEEKYLDPEALYYTDEWAEENLLKVNNPDLTQETLQKFMNEFDPMG